MNCKECGKPLAEINFNGHIVSICYNWSCPLYRERQGIRAKVVAEVVAQEPKISKRHKPSYPAFLERRKPKRRERYHAIRSLGLDSRQSLWFRDRTSMPIEDIKELAERKEWEEK